MSLALYALFPLLCVLSVPERNCRGAFAERVMFGVAVYEGLLFVIGTVPASFGFLSSGTYAALTWLAAALLVVQATRQYRHPATAHLRKWLQTRRGATVALLFALLIAAYALQIAIDSLYGTKHVDGLWYHIPRMIFWLQQESFEPWMTPVAAQIGLPVGGDVILGQKIFLGYGWRGIGYVTGVVSVGAIAAVYLIALDLGLTRWQAAVSSVLFGSFPAVGLRIWAVNTDILAAFPALAAFAALHIVRNTGIGLSLFILLNALAIACKPTTAPVILILTGTAIWRSRRRLLDLTDLTAPISAATIASLAVFASYYPVYLAFSDFLGGDYSRAHKSSTFAEFCQGVAMHTGHWILEPLGYLTPVKEGWVRGVAKGFYNGLGAGFQTLPEMWKPWPAQDIGYTGLASVLMLPVLIVKLPGRARVPAALLFLLAYIPLSGMILPQPYFSRYNVMVLPGYAMIWCATGLFARGYGRWLLTAIVAVNVCALGGVVSARAYVDQKICSTPNGRYDFISEKDRQNIASSLNGRPLLVVTDNTMDALLVGPSIDYGLNYITCPEDGDWNKELVGAAEKSGWLALVHNGEESMHAGPEWKRPGHHACDALISRQKLDGALNHAGWRMYKKGSKVDLYRFDSQTL